MNPLDTELHAAGRRESDAGKVFGCDAAEIVIEAGPEVADSRPGDGVFYLDPLTETGAHGEFRLTDERIGPTTPATPGWAETEALPSTAVTAWDAPVGRPYEKGRAPSGAAPAVPIVDGGGDIASVAAEFARSPTDLTVVAAAACLEMAAQMNAGFRHRPSCASRWAVETGRRSAALWDEAGRCSLPSFDGAPP